MFHSAGVGPIWLWKMKCEGHEKSLADCDHGYLNSSSCTHANDAGVRCIVPEIGVDEQVLLETLLYHTYMHAEGNSF